MFFTSPSSSSDDSPSSSFTSSVGCTAYSYGAEEVNIDFVKESLSSSSLALGSRWSNYFNRFHLLSLLTTFLSSSLITSIAFYLISVFGYSLQSKGLILTILSENFGKSSCFSLIAKVRFSSLPSSP